MWPTGVGASAAGASARARHRALAAEHRVERLLTGLVLGLSAGVIVAGVSGWRPAAGVIAGVLLVHVTAHRVRPGPVRNWRLGAAAERRTGRRLATLDPALFTVLHDRALLRGVRRNLDHLVIGPTGVYAVVTRRWRWGSRLWADHHRLWAGTTPVTGDSELTRRIARLVADLLSAELGGEPSAEAPGPLAQPGPPTPHASRLAAGPRVEVLPVLAVHGVRAPRTGLRHGGVIVHRARRLPGFIGGRAAVLGEGRVAAIAEAAERIFPPMPPSPL